MKNLFIVLSFILFSLNLNGQASVDDIFSKYAKLENASRMVFDKDFIKSNTSISERLVKGEYVDQVELVIISGEDGLIKEDYYALINAAKANNLEEAIKVKDGTRKVDVLFVDEGELISDILIIVKNEETSIIARLDGRILKSKINDQELSLEGFDLLKQIGG